MGHTPGGHDNEVRPPAFLGAGQVGQHGDRHHRLAQPHLVGQDAVQALVVHRVEPVQADQLRSRGCLGTPGPQFMCDT